MSENYTALVRPSAIAGTWYPGRAGDLRRMVEDYLAAVTPAVLPGPLLALVSPHAGYAYSGPTAAHAYAQVQGADFRRVVLLGPLHQPLWGAQGPFLVPAEGAYRTPLGDVPLDGDFLAALGQDLQLTPVRGDQEHSLEIQLPFLQVVLGDFSLVPVMLGWHISEPGAEEAIDSLAAALAEVADEQTLLVASTDLSHLYDHAQVLERDQELVKLVNRFHIPEVKRALRQGRAQACGATGLVAVLEAARRRGARGARVLAYTTSGDVTGQKQPGTYTVGYMAAAVYD